MRFPIFVLVAILTLSALRLSHRSRKSRNLMCQRARVRMMWPPPPDGSVWYTAQRLSALGRLDPETGETRHIPLGEWLRAAWRHRRAGMGTPGSRTAA